MRVLVTNDDGVEAPGLHALASAHSTPRATTSFVVAPSGQRSGSGAAIGRLHRAGPDRVDAGRVARSARDRRPRARRPARRGGVRRLRRRVRARSRRRRVGREPGHELRPPRAALRARSARRSPPRCSACPAVAVSIAWGDEQQLRARRRRSRPTRSSGSPPSPGAPMVVNLNVPERRARRTSGVSAARGSARSTSSGARRRRPASSTSSTTATRRSPEPDSDFAVVRSGAPR